MSALEIVLVSVLGFALALYVVYVLVLRGLRVNKANSYRILNTHAQKNCIVLFGDSLTDFFPVQEFFPNPTIYNRGIASDTTKNLLARLDNVIDIEPSKLFLLIGTNDLGKGSKPAEIIARIELIINKIREKCPDVKIFLSSQYPIRRNKNFYSFFACYIRSNKKLLEINELEKKLCEKIGVTYLDMWEVLTDYTGKLRKDYTPDGLHLTTLGYCAIVEKLAPFIQE